MNTPLVSVAVCTYNGEKYISSQLDTIINQSYKNIEIIVVDDGSTDNTCSILEQYQKKGKIKFYRNTKNLGFIRNFEKAIKLCNGDYIALSDQDDLWELNKIEVLVNNIGDNILIYSDSEFIDSNGKAMEKRISDLHNLISGKKRNMAFLFFNCIAGHAILFKKELLKSIFPFPQQLFHDWWIGYCATTVGTITCVPKPLVQYRQHRDNIADLLMEKAVNKIEPKSNNTPGRHKIASSEARKKEISIKINRLKVFYSAPCNSEKDRKFIAHLIHAYRQKQSSIFAIHLFFIFLVHYNRFFCIQKESKGLKRKTKFLLKEVQGVEMKVKFHNTMSTLRSSFGA